MSMIRHRYRTVSGEVRVYEYPPRPYVDAATQALHMLNRRGALIRVGKDTWRAGPRSKRTFYTSTLEALISRGVAVRDGDIIRRAQ